MTPHATATSKRTFAKLQVYDNRSRCLPVLTELASFMVKLTCSHAIAPLEILEMLLHKKTDRRCKIYALGRQYSWTLRIS